MTKKFLWLAALAVAALAAPALAAAQRVGPVEEEPAASAPATSGGAAKAEKKADAAKPADKDSTKTSTKADDKAAAKTDAKATATPAPPGKTAPEVASKSDANKSDTNKTDTNKTDTKASDAKPSSPASSSASSPTPAPSPSTLPNGEATHAARGEKAASPAPAVSAPPTQTNQQPPITSSIGSGTPPAPPKYEAPAPVKADPPPTSNSTNAAATNAAAPPPTSIYRLGAGDILDIRMTGSISREPTLYTVLSNGTIDYPLAGEPTRVAGLTPEEIGARLSEAIKRRGIFDRAQFQVSVREYVSHTALVSGLVDQPGQKVLRREAVPLYVVLAEAFPRPEAGRVVIISRATGQTKTLDLSDSNALNELVTNGDVVNVQPRPREFYYIGGTIGAAGQKDFTPGMTLTQAILASGGLTREAGSKVRVAVARQGADGKLITAEYDLREIEAGRIPDPRIQPGDRIDVGRKR